MGSRGSSMYNSMGKRRHYSTLLLVALGIAMLSALVVHKLREGRVLGLLLQERERQLLTLTMILEKERVRSDAMKAKIEELKAKAVDLKTQKMQLNDRLMEAENLAAYQKNKRAELESALEEMQNELASLKGVEEASMKADLRVAALTDLLKQQQDHAEEMERRLQQPSGQPVHAALVDDVSERNETDESSSKEEVVANTDDGAQATDGAEEVGNSEHEQGSKGRQWVRLETNTDDGESVDDGGDKGAEEVDDGKQEKISEEGTHSEVGFQVGDQNAVEITVVNHNNTVELLPNSTAEGEPPVMINTSVLLLDSSTDGGLPIMKEEVPSSNTTETNVVASEDGQLGKEKNNANGEEKQTTDNTETSVRGRRSRRMKSRGRKRRAAARSWARNTEASKYSQAGNSQHEGSSKMGEKPDNQVFDRNVIEVNSGEVQRRAPQDQTASTQAEAADQQPKVNSVSLEASAGSNGDEISEAKSASIESYRDTNGSEEKSNGDNKNDSDNTGEQQTASSSEELNMSESAQHEGGGQESIEENNVRSTMEASEESATSNGGQTGNFHDTKEGESSGKEAEGNEQPVSVLLRERDGGDEEKKPNVSTDSIPQAASATKIAEDGQEEGDPQEAAVGNSTEEKPVDDNKAEEGDGGQSEHEEDESSNEDVNEF